MNSLGDFSTPGGIPVQTYNTSYSHSRAMSLSQQMYPGLASKNFSFPTPSPSLKPKSTMGTHNGYQNGISPVSPIAPPKPKLTECNGNGYFNHSNPSAFSGPGPTPKQSFPPEKTTILMDGRVKNLPQSMVNDQFGLAAFFVGLKAAKCLGSVPDALFQDVITEMSAHKNDEPMYKRFSGPLGLPSEPESFSTEGAQANPVYPEYLVTQRMIAESREVDINYVRKTWALKMDKFGEDLLFYCFYTFTQDVLQVMAARNLYEKGWRYHIEARVWMQKMDNGMYQTDPGNPLKEKGVYKYFDYPNWKIAQVEMILDTSKLEAQPITPPEYFAQSQSQSNQKKL